MALLNLRFSELTVTYTSTDLPLTVPALENLSERGWSNAWSEPFLVGWATKAVEGFLPVSEAGISTFLMALPCERTVMFSLVMVN